jgi:hypothetical protein
MSRRRRRPVGGGGHGRGAGAEPALGDGDDDQDDEKPGAVASSTSAAGSGTRVKEQHASVPLRRSRSFECLVRSFSTNSRPALRAASGRPPARRRHDGHRGTGLTLQPRGSQSRHERPVGAHLGHAPTDSSGQPRSTTDPSACRFTCADAVDQHPARNHTVYGMQGVRGSNPLSSTTVRYSNTDLLKSRSKGAR